MTVVVKIIHIDCWFSSHRWSRYAGREAEEFKWMPFTPSGCSNCVHMKCFSSAVNDSQQGQTAIRRDVDHSLSSSSSLQEHHPCVDVSTVEWGGRKMQSRSSGLSGWHMAEARNFWHSIQSCQLWKIDLKGLYGLTCAVLCQYKKQLSLSVTMTRQECSCVCALIFYRNWWNSLLLSWAII